MPGYVIHLATANSVLQRLDIRDGEYKNKYLLGNIVPDLNKREEKKICHFWSDDSMRLLIRRPRLETFLGEYGNRLSEPFIFGYYSHLYLDYSFLKKYWDEYFVFYNEELEPAEGYYEIKKVYVKNKKKMYDRESFLSDELYYGDYTRMIPYMAAKCDGLPFFDETLGIKELRLEGRAAEYEKMIAGCREYINKKGKGTLDKEPGLMVFDRDIMDRLIEETADELVEIYVKEIQPYFI